MKSKLKFGVVIDGTDIFVQPILQALREKYEVEIFNPRFIRIPCVGKRVNDWLLKQQLQQFLNKNEVVFFEWAGSLAALASTLPGQAQRIIRAHRTELFSAVENINWSNIDQVILVSHAMRLQLLKLCPQAKEIATVVHNGVNLSLFEPFQRLSTDTLYIGMMGNLTPRKRVYDIICSLADLPEDVSWQLFVGGAPVEMHIDYWYALQDLVKTLKVDNQVRFNGTVQNTTAWFQAIDIYISASYSEGHQVALLEAMASGCYCLSHCWTGIREILTTENIFITPDDLNEKLIHYSTLSKVAKQKVQTQMRAITEEKFDQQRMIKEITEVIHTML